MKDQSEQTGEAVHGLEAQRRANRQAVAELGLDPYGARTDGLMDLASAAARYDAAADQEYQQRESERREYFQHHPDGADAPPPIDRRPRVKVAGRVMLHRDNGKLVWMNLRDHSSESLQVAVSKRDCSASGFEVAKLTDLGDLVVVSGPLMKTRAGEVTVWADAVEPAGKCLMPPPEKHAGLQDRELRYRQRYVDMWSNYQTTRVFQLRSLVVSEIRRFLVDRGYLEVETPMLQTQAGGAAARPFITHMNALGIDLYMRIAPELYLKRLLVGGLPRIFEINRNFRNEGLDKQHNPEFTMLELYQAYGNYHTVMELTEELVRHAAKVAAAARADEVRVDPEAPSLPFGSLQIDYGRPFDRVTYAELFERALGFAPADTARVRAEAEARGISTRNEQGQEIDAVFVANELFEEFAEKTLDPSRPTWIMDYPASLSPLTRPSKADPAVAERADLFIAGMEIGPHYTELNDPDVQAAKFREQLAGIDEEESTFRTFDEDFICALKVGMPPAGGMGLGVDRLMMLLADQPTIRDVILFPLMRPLRSGQAGPSDSEEH
ncbi:MAG: lysine--tRNA ligase [Phycisphaerales bacterium]